MTHKFYKRMLKKPAKRIDNPLYPVHHSVAGARIQPRPQCMDSVRIPHEMRAELSRVALDIFTDMTNVNLSFQDAFACDLPERPCAWIGYCEGARVT